MKPTVYIPYKDTEKTYALKRNGDLLYIPNNEKPVKSRRSLQDLRIRPTHYRIYSVDQLKTYLHTILDGVKLSDLDPKRK